MKQMNTIDMEAPYDVTHVKDAGEVVMEAFRILYQNCHAASYNRGWWHDPITGMSLIPGEPLSDGDRLSQTAEAMRTAWFPYVIATKIALIHSEVSEMLEADRTDAQDDKINFPGITAEAGDTIIRICDLLSMKQAYTERFEEYDVALAILAKMPVNLARADHALENRRKPGGKKY